KTLSPNKVLWPRSSADDQEVLVVLDWKTLVSLLVNVAISAGVVVSMVSHGMRAAHPGHEATHFSIHQRAQDEMIVIGHKLVAKKMNLVDLQALVQNPFKRIVIRFLVEDFCAHIATIKSVSSTARQ